MGFHLQSVRGDLSYSANVWLMELLVAAMAESGAELRKRSRRRFDPSMQQEPVEAELLQCFRSNDGWLVTPAEAREIADKVGKALPGWVAHPIVVRPKGVLLYARQRDAEGEVTQWGEAVEVDLSAPAPQAAEIGASRQTVQRVEEFVEFCRQASAAGGFYVY